MTYTREQLDFIRRINSGVGESTQESKPGKKEYRSKKKQGEDLTVDGYINKYGGIESNIDGKVYTSKPTYMEHIKANNCTIKDW